MQVDANPCPCTPVSKKTRKFDNGSSEKTARPDPPRDAAEPLMILTPEQRRELITKGAELGSQLGQHFAHATKCTFCGRGKHEVAWEYKIRDVRGRPRERICPGAQCYSCVKAASQLKITRKSHVIKSVSGVLEVLLNRSRVFSRMLGTKDVCNCAACCKSRKKQQLSAIVPFRLRQKTRLV